MKIVEIIARCLFILCVPVILLSAGIAVALNSHWFYEQGFDKYYVSQTTGLSDTELSRAAEGLIDYFNSREEYISVTVVKDGQSFVLFNEREIGHLKDVKDLFRLDYRLLLWTSVYCLVYALAALFWRHSLYRRGLANGMFGGGVLTLGLMLVIGTGIWLAFDQLFWQFHVLSFDNDLWLLNPATDYLVMLFPQGFWFDATVFIALFTALGAVVLGGAGLWWRLKTDKKAGA